jgi:hypothetical protein
MTQRAQTIRLALQMLSSTVLLSRWSAAVPLELRFFHPMKVRHALSRHRALLIMVTRAALTLPFVAGLTTITAPFSQANGRATVLAIEDEQLLDDLERTAFQFFAEQTHPQTGLVRDRARADGSPSEGKASIAASGFAFDAWVIATERGWTTRDEALSRVRVMLRFLVESAPRRHGFFYHFMEMETGARAWNCEVSSIDTSLCLAGAIVAREYFQDDEVTALVNRLYREIDWQWFLNEGLSPSLGWHDGHGFSRYRWRGFAEHLLMHLLGLGAPDHAFDRETWQAWERCSSTNTRRPTSTCASAAMPTRTTITTPCSPRGPTGNSASTCARSFRAGASRCGASPRRIR